MNSEISFWKYIRTYGIEIPIVQRDYAQGRKGKEYLRESFLKNLKQALDKNLPDSEQVLKLDFVYGAMTDGKMSPLDGQQRLTTLWLLHWFIAYKADKLNDEVRECLKNFSYATRISSTEFCECLATKNLLSNTRQLNFLKNISYDNLEGVNSNNEWEKKVIIQLKGTQNKGQFDKALSKLRKKWLVSSVIQNQAWFHSSWNQDPTVQSMLRMLSGTTINNKEGKDIIDGMEEIFESSSPSDFNFYWKSLISENCPIIFYQLPMHEFKLTDDLYIKMNARGKQLTSFENFKAELLGYIREKGWADLLDSVNGIGVKMDNAWTDIFWEVNRSSKGKIDELYFTFLNRFFLNYKLKDIDENNQYYVFFTQKGNDLGDNAICFNTLENYKWENEIDRNLFDDLKIVLDNYKRSNIISSDLCAPWDDKFRFIPEYVKENGSEIFADKDKTYLKVTSINQVQRVVFYAVCKYLKEGSAEEGKTSLKRWMRFVWNMVSVKSADGNPTIRSASEMKTAIVFIEQFDAHHIYENLCTRNLVDKERPSQLEIQLNEEIMKAIRMYSTDGSLIPYEGELRNENGVVYPCWEDVIRCAESCAFFNGSIRFLFTSEDGTVEWKDFDTKFENARSAFDREYISTIVLRNLICRISNWDTLTSIMLDSEEKSWRNILCSSSLVGEVHHLLANPLYDSGQLSQIPSPFEGARKMAHEDLYKTELTRQLRWQPFKLTDGSPYRLVPPGAWAQYKIYHIGTPRNRILTAAFKEGHVYSNHTEQRLADSGFFWGDNIYFNYKSEKYQHVYRFQWWHNRKDGKFDVYLMTAEWEYTKRKHEFVCDTDEGKYFCANVPNDSDTDTLYSIFDRIIEQYKDEITGVFDASGMTR